MCCSVSVRVDVSERVGMGVCRTVISSALWKSLGSHIFGEKKSSETVMENGLLFLSCCVS